MKNPASVRRPVTLRRIVGFGMMASAIGLSAAVSEAPDARDAAVISAMHRTSVVHPLDTVALVGRPGGSVTVTDSRGREYVKMKFPGNITMLAGGAPGTHTVTLVDRRGQPIGSASFRVEARTEISDGGSAGELFGLLRDEMMAENPRGYDEVIWKGRAYRYAVNWVLDNNNTMRGMQYFSPWSGDLVDLLRENQKPDGMIWSFVNSGEKDSYYFETAYNSLGYFRRDADAWFVRQPVENHVEYNFVNMMYQHWKASGDNDWMQKNLECAVRALDYSVTDTLRWSKRFLLLKRPYCIDSWDFQVNDEYTPPAPLSPTMVLVPGKTRYGIFFGDNTGYYDACNQLAEMLDHSGDRARADLFRRRGAEILKRLVALSWNGKFFTHFIDEDPEVQRNLGVDEKTQIAQGNMYSLNRGLPREMNAAIINTYRDLRNHLPAGSPGEWYAIYPPFERGFGGHNEKWQYMNGGIAGHGMGELARGAYENGYESYASDIMSRMLSLIRKHGNRLYFAYTGSIPSPPPPPALKTVDISGEANMDLWDKGGANVFPWMDAGRASGNDMRGLPTGIQTFHGISFRVIDPENNQRRAVVAVSTLSGYPREAEIPVGDSAAAVYLLHSSSDNIPSHVAGAVSFVYDDGTESTQYLMKGKDVTNWWFASLDNERAGVAWWGPNLRSVKVGVCWAAIENPHPHTFIRKLVFHAPLEGGIYAVIGVTLADRPHYVRPKEESYGGPDNWAAATGMAALVEGLAGVKNTGLAYSEAVLSPRWVSSAVDSARVTVTYPASNGYVAYRYRHHPETREISLLVTGSGNEVRGHILLPRSASSVTSVTAKGRSVPFSTPTIGESRYVDFLLQLPEVQEVNIRYQQ